MVKNEETFLNGSIKKVDKIIKSHIMKLIMNYLKDNL